MSQSADVSVDESYDMGMDSDGNMSVDDQDSDCDSYVSIDVEPQEHKEAYTIVTVDDLVEKSRDAVQVIMAVLQISEEEATHALHLYNWDVTKLNECWFSDEEKIRQKVGLCAQAVCSTSAKKTVCPVCFDTFKTTELLGAPCGHLFCKNCWHGYVTAALENQKIATDLRCPAPKCQVLVPKAIVNEVATEAQRERIAEMNLRSIVDDNAQASWCTGPGCQLVALCRSEPPANEPMDILCKCGQTYCFVCHEEAHRPVDCATVRKWLLKNSAESENLTWIIANTKACPKCGRPIEKNQGCMHMSCTQCKFEFCWLCLGAWSDHGERTGGFYTCNRFEEERKTSKFQAEESKVRKAQASLNRYHHYYQHFAEHDKSRALAMEELKLASTKQLKDISELTKTPDSQLKFILQAHQQVVQCRRVLKWTYAYGYYHFDEDQFSGDEDGPPRTPSAPGMLEADVEAMKQRREFFQFLQGIAVHSLEELSNVLEKDLKNFHDPETDKRKEWDDEREKHGDAVFDEILEKEFMNLQTTLISKTEITKRFFAKLVDRLSNGLSTLAEEYSALPASTPSS